MKFIWRGQRPDVARSFERVLERFDDRLNPIDSVHAEQLADGRVRSHFSTSLSGHGYVNDTDLARVEARLAESFVITVRDPEELLAALERHYAKAPAPPALVP